MWRSSFTGFLLVFSVAVDGYCSVPAFSPSLSTTSASLRLRGAATGLSSLCMVNEDRRGAIGLFTSFLVVAGSHPVSAKRTQATAEDTAAAFKKLLEVQEQLDGADALSAAKDWAGILALLDQPEFKGIEATLLTLVSGPVLSAEDKKTIGTRKRYGIAADVLFGIGGVQAAIASIDDPQLQACSSGQCSGDFVSASVEVPKTLKTLKAALKEIIGICKSYKEFK